MFWIMLSIIGLVATGIQLCKYVKETRKNEGYVYFSTQGVVYIIITVICMFIAAIQLGTGITDYPRLIKKQAEVESLQNRIQDIRNSTYKYKKDGNFVAGSVENLSQSTNLSKFISDLAQKEADYTGYLKKCKVFREVFVLRFFANGWAISDRINDLPTTFVKK